MAGKLRITGGPAAGNDIELGDEFVVGRSEQPPGRLGGDPEISRRHARFESGSEGLAVEDLGSRNGTFVDGERVTGRRALSGGETVRMGQTTIIVEAPRDPDATRTGTPVVAPADDDDATQQAPTPEPAADATAPLGGPPSTPPPGEQPPGAPAPPPPPAAPPPPPAPAPWAGQPPARGGGNARIAIAAVVGVLVVGGVAAALLLSGGDDDDGDGGSSSSQPAGQDRSVEGPAAVTSAASAAGCTAQDEPEEGRQHTEGSVTYRSNPPSSGPHDPIAAGDGAYDTAPKKEALVHSLEHGRIVMWFKPGDTATRDKLRKIGDRDSYHMILSPNETDMPYAVAASAWTHILGCPQMNAQVPAAIEAFRDAYRDKAPEQVP